MLGRREAGPRRQTPDATVDGGGGGGRKLLVDDGAGQGVGRVIHVASRRESPERAGAVHGLRENGIPALQLPHLGRGRCHDSLGCVIDPDVIPCGRGRRVATRRRGTCRPAWRHSREVRSARIGWPRRARKIIRIRRPGFRAAHRPRYCQVQWERGRLGR